MSGSLTSPEAPPTRPYLVRALYDWCTDNGFTPYVAVYVDDAVQVPREFVKNNEIVLNISMDATGGLKLGNDFIEFKARFGGVARSIMVPMDRVLAIYARENGQGMAFPVPAAQASSAGPEAHGNSPALSSVPSPLLDSLSEALGESPAQALLGSSPHDDSKHAPSPTLGGSVGGADAQVIPLGATHTGPGNGPTGAEGDEPPHPPRTPVGSRPALKRVK